MSTFVPMPPCQLTTAESAKLSALQSIYSAARRVGQISILIYFAIAFAHGLQNTSYFGLNVVNDTANYMINAINDAVKVTPVEYAMWVDYFITIHQQQLILHVALLATATCFVVSLFLSDFIEGIKSPVRRKLINS